MKKRVALPAAALVLALALAMGGCTVMESTYMKKVSEADGLSKELAALQQKYKDLSFENSMLKARVANLSGDLEKSTGERDKFSADNKELENLLKAKSDSLSQTIMDLRQKIGGLENENARLKQEVAALQKAQEEKVQKVSKTYEDLLVKMKGEIAKGEVTISELKGKLTVNMVDAILFDSGKAEVKTEGQAVLQKVISILKDVKDKAIRTEGHTDNVQIIGMLAKKYPTNWELSAARAINVTRYLQEQGLDPAILSAVAYGEYKPVAANDTPEGKQKNRRIEIILVPKE
ncbi:MAG: OmpA family protein [Deltaproteobacteria bacterium]|nr:OmpA family protein [Deltaproteobacteria bacterium]